jgi:uncharacterized protein
MGDLSAEPSMEEILSSIKRIIAEEGEAPSRPRRPSRAAPAPAPADEVLELSDPIPAAPAPAPGPVDSLRRDRPQALPAEPDPAPERLEAVAASPEHTAEPIASPRTVGASRDALQSLSRMMVKPDAGADGTLEGLVREMLRPMLRDWLDQNLPQIVETAVAREVARIAREGA